MIIRLAIRSLAVRPVRTFVLACGFGLGIAVMAALLGVGEVILEQGVMIGPRVAGLVVQPEDSIDIDTPLDLALAELVLARRAAAV